MFIDADKENNPHYLDWAVRLGRPGTAIVMDNVVWEGAVLDPSMDTVNAPGIISALTHARRGPEAGRHRHPDRGLQRMGRLRPGDGCCNSREAATPAGSWQRISESAKCA